jgi:hypothetical protein
VRREELDDLRSLRGPAPGAEAKALLHVDATARARRRRPASGRRSRDLFKACGRIERRWTGLWHTFV